MTLFKRPCVRCEYLQEHIEFLHGEAHKSCQTCVTLKEQVKYLQTQLEIMRNDRVAERDEFKRMVDRALQVQGIPPVGQGPSNKKEASNRDLMGMFSLEVEDGPDGPIVRQLRESEMN